MRTKLTLCWLKCALNESKENPMGDYLLLQWLGTRRGLVVFVLLLVIDSVLQPMPLLAITARRD